jgi:hypothetical protein
MKLRKSETAVELGAKYRDKVTGFEGVAVARYEYLWGCNRISLEHLGSDGKPQAAVFDEPQIERTGPQQVRTEAPKLARTGGPHDHAAAPRR